MREDFSAQRDGYTDRLQQLEFLQYSLTDDSYGKFVAK